MSRMVGTGLVAVLGMLVAVSPAQAQAEKGDSDVTAFGLLATAFSEGETVNIGAAIFSVGRFISDRSQVGGGPILIFASGGGETEATTGVDAYFRRYFAGRGRGQVYPYVGGEVLIFDVSPPEGVSIADLSFAAGIGGLKYYLTRNTAIDTRALFGVSMGGAGSLVQFTVGISYLF